jgi:predicted nicotinamide N-methyase
MQHAKSILVPWGSDLKTVWVSGAFDQHLDEFAVEVGGHLTDERCPFGVLLWPCARALASTLREQPGLFPRKPRRIVELGCGVGFISCVLATLYPDAEILACDYERGLQSYVERNAAEWGLKDRVSFRWIDWRQAPPLDLRSSCDWVVGTDVFYDDSHLESLPPFASALLKDSGWLTLADPKRYRFGKVLKILERDFQLREHLEVPTSLVGEGIEDFMITAGKVEVLTSILHLSLAPDRMDN